MLPEEMDCRESCIPEVCNDLFVLIPPGNEIKDPIEALEIYRNKDLVVKALGNMLIGKP